METWYFWYTNQIMVKLKLSAAALAVLAVQMAVPTAMASGCSVSALDTVAGLGTEVYLKGCASLAGFEISVKQPDGPQYPQFVTTDSNGEASTLIPSKYTETAGKYEVMAGSSSAFFTVIADRADDAHSNLIASAYSLSGPDDSLTVTIILRDRYDNPVSGRPIALVTSRFGDEAVPQAKQTDDLGRLIWQVRSGEPGVMSLIPYDILSGRQLKLKVQITVGSYAANSWLRGSLTGQGQGNEPVATSITADSAGFSDLSGAAVDHFELELPQGQTEVNANDLFSMNIRAMRGDEFVRAYVGTLIVKSSDPDAELPKKGEDPKSPATGRIDIRDIDQGQRKVALAFVLRKEGEQTIEVYDKDVPSISGKVTLFVKRSGALSGGRIQILSPKDRSRIRGDKIVLQGKAPSLVNLVVKGGKEQVTGESDSEGVFRIPVELNPEDREVTIFVSSENNSYESQPVHIIIDNDPPKIDSMVMDPEAGKAGNPAELTVKSEPELASASVNLEGTDYKLSGSGGIYTATFAAPAKEGSFDVTATLADSVGNTSSMLLKWDVKPALLPVVQNVKAEGKPREVQLTWQHIVAAPVSQYRIYIAKDSDPKNFIYSVTTLTAVSSAVIKDLPLGETYQFSLTALNSDGLESPEKSKPAVASPLGITLKAKSGNDSVLLEWNPLPSLPLDHYRLRFGPGPENLSESRAVDGEAVSFVVHDLIGGTTYWFSLTPVTVTGKIMEELTASVSATVGAAVFVPGIFEPVPSELIGHPGAPAEPVIPPPATPSSGISSIITIALVMITFLIGLMHWRRIVTERRLAADFFDLMSRKYHS